MVELKIGDKASFIKKTDKKEIIEAEIVEITLSRIYFFDLNFPDVGKCSFVIPSLLSFYNIKKVEQC